MSSSTTSRYRESAAVTAPSKAQDQHHSAYAEEHALDAIAKDANRRLQQQSEQNREARQLRTRELERNARDDDGSDSGSTPVTPSTSMGANRSRLMSIDGINNGTNSNSSLLQKFLNGDTNLRSIDERDLRRLLSELEAKYKTAMIVNSSIFNEKQALRYQVDSFKDQLEDHYETLNQAKRQLKEKSRDFDLQKRSLNDLQQENKQLKEILAAREKLIQESGLQMITGDEMNGNSGEDKFSSVLPMGLVSAETQSLLNSLGKGTIDEKLKRILNEKREQFEQIVKFKSELDEEKQRFQLLQQQMSKFNESHQHHNGINDSEQQKQLAKEINDLRNRLQRLEAENSTLQQEKKRYDVQFQRQKQQIDDAERTEEELKKERRQLQKECRAAREELENERTNVAVLQRENERLRTLRKKTLLKDTEENLLIPTIISTSQFNSPLSSAISSSSNDLQYPSSFQDPT